MNTCDCDTLVGDMDHHTAGGGSSSIHHDVVKPR